MIWVIFWAAKSYWSCTYFAPQFVAVLNSKKAKLRELRDRISKLEAAGKGPAADDVSSDKTEKFDEGTDEEKVRGHWVDDPAILLTC